jgi:hypothetical protein
MNRIGLAAIGLIFVSQGAAAASTWLTIDITATPQNTPAVVAAIVAATDKLMSSPAGMEFPGKLLLQASLANGADPATHTFVPIYKSTADREAFAQKLQADPAWPLFQASMAKLSQPVSTVLNGTLKSWGDVNDTDGVWQGAAFAVKDPAAFFAALDKLMASETGKKFPGQVYLSQVIAGGITKVTHLISVGFASEVEMAAWNDSLVGNADWTAYLDASRASSEYLGSNLSRTLKSWGKATMKDVTAGSSSK